MNEKSSMTFFFIDMRSTVSFIIIAILLLSGTISLANANVFQPKQFWSGTFTCKNSSEKRNLGVYFTKSENLKRRGNKVSAIMVFKDPSSGFSVLSTFAFVKPRNQSIGFAGGNKVYSDGYRNTHRLQGKIIDNGHTFAGTLQDAYCRPGKFSITLEPTSSTNELKKIARNVWHALENRQNVSEYINKKYFESGKAKISVGASFSGSYTVSSGIDSKIHFTITTVTPTYKTGEVRLKADCILQATFDGKITELVYHLEGNYDDNKQRLRLIPTTPTKYVIALNNKTHKPLYLAPVEITGNVSNDGASFTTDSRYFGISTTISRQSEKVNYEKSYARAEKAAYNRTLTYSQKCSQKFQNLLKDEELRIAIDKHPIVPTFVECVSKLRQTKGTKIRVMDVDACRTTYMSRIDVLTAEIKDAKEKRERLAELRRNEASDLWIFKHALHVSKNYSPQEVKKTIENLSGVFIRSLKSPYGRIDVYETLTINSELPITYIRFNNDTGRLKFSSVYFWVAPIIDKIDPGLISKSGPIGIVIAGQILKERLKFQNSLLQKYGNPSEVNGKAVQSLSEDKDGFEMTFKFLSDLRNGVQNMKWFRDSGQSYVAFRPYSALPAFLQSNYPREIYNFRHVPDGIRVLEFSNNLQTKNIKRKSSVNNAF